MNEPEHKELEHKELSKKIFKCSCIPIGKNYCKECQEAVIEFMNKYGAGTLTRDLLAYDLKKENEELKNTQLAFQEHLEIKTKEVERLTLLTGRKS